jgi:ADP-heptose:LPS heptosyltransferase
MTPAERAAAILESIRGLDAAAVETALARPDHPALAHIEALADEADSDDEAQRKAGLGALFGGVVEPLNDGFTPAGRAAYARLFPRALWRVAARAPELAEALEEFEIEDEAALLARYRRARAQAHPAPERVRRAAVLSRVTIGADVLLTSVALQRIHDRWPGAEILLLGDGKLAGLFGGLPGVRVVPVAYPRRGPLRARVAGWLAALGAVRREEADLVLAPDSRLDQLGILPLIDEARYLLWENTQPAGAPAASLADLLDLWLARRLGLPEAPRRLPRLGFDAHAISEQRRLAAAIGPRPLAAVKLDHGGNPAKALPRAAEIEILRALRERGWRVLLDRGFGDEELANSDALLDALGWRPRDLDDSGRGLGHPLTGLAPGALANEDVIRFHGSIAGWAAALSSCGLALSYDSVGHHLAAALGVPVVVAFTGHADDSFPIAWQPRGPGRVAVVAIPTTAKERPEQWSRVIEVLPRPEGR